MRPIRFIPTVAEISAGDVGSIRGLDAVISYWTEGGFTAEEWFEEVNSSWGPAGFLVRRGDGSLTAVTLLAAPEGVQRLREETAHIDAPLTLVTAGLDERLDERGYIVPGLGDAGDRLYGLAG